MGRRESLYREGRMEGLWAFGNSDGVTEWFAESFPRDFGNVAVFDAKTFPEAEAVGTEEVNVGVSRATVSIVFEVVMLQVLQRV